jgi:diacylglycerol O-acyltransferase
VRLLGARVREVVPVTTTTGNAPVVFGALSYAGVLTLTVVVDPDIYPELDALVTDLPAELDALCAAPPSIASPAGSAAAQVTRLMTPSHR